MTPAAAAYSTLPVNERQEFRLSALLKKHLNDAAKRTGKSVTDYITTAVAEQVARDLAQATEWNLTIPEQEVLLRSIANPTSPSQAAKDAAARADTLFGPLPTSSSKV